MKSNKKAVSMYIVGLIIAVISLLTFFPIITGAMTTAKYESSILQCQKFFEGIDGKAIYWGNKFDTPSLSLLNLISSFCPSKDVGVTSKDVTPAADLISDCWKKTGEGIDIMGVNSQDKNVCVFCGFVKSNGEVTNFNENLISELQKEKYDFLKVQSETTNSNPDFLYNKDLIPQTITKEKPLAVIYFTYKPNYVLSNTISNTQTTTFGTISNSVSSGACSFFGGLGGLATTASYFACDSNENTLTGITLEEWEYIENDIQFKTDKEVNVKVIPNNKFPKIKCDELIIPQENFK